MPTKITPQQEACLSILGIHSRPHGEFCIGFGRFTDEGDLQLNRAEVRRNVRALARKGLAEFHKGLFTDEGEPAGAGYCITIAGLNLLDLLANPGTHK